METHKFYCSGETLTRLIADAFADLNNIERGEGDALSYEVQIRRALDAGIEDGDIQKLTHRLSYLVTKIHYLKIVFLSGIKF